MVAASGKPKASDYLGLLPWIADRSWVANPDSVALVESTWREGVDSTSWVDWKFYRCLLVGDTLVRRHDLGMTQNNKMSPFQSEEVANAYDQWAKTYEAVENATRDLAARVLRQYPLDLRDRDILEIGCGTGLNTGYLADHAKELVAFDFSAGMLEQARAKITARNVRFVQCDIQHDWPLDKESVDLVICMLVLEHIANLDHVFQEALRVLRCGGEFFICELHPYKQLQGLQAKFTDANSGNVVLVQAFLHDVSDYVNASIKSGFEVIQLAEWRDDKDEDKTKPPRLLSLHVRTTA